MRLLPKLTLGILAASAIPLAIAGAISARLSESALRARIQQDHAAIATGAADGAARFFGGVASALAIYPELVDLEAASPDVATGVLRLAYRSEPSLAVVALLDADGRERIPSVHVATREDADLLGGRPVVSDEDRAAFLRRVPIAEGLARGRAIGPVALAGSPAEARCAVVIAFDRPGGRYLLAADVSLARLHAQLAALSVGGVDVTLVDRERRVVAGGAATAALQPARLPEATGGGLPTRVTVASLVGAAGPALAALAPVANSGFGVLVTQPEGLAFAHVRDLRRRTMFWLGVCALLALIVGVGLARDVSRRVGRLAAGTVAVARGDFSARLDDRGRDELAELAGAFNRMAEELGVAARELRARHQEIQNKNKEIGAKNEEILRWNAELEARVERKTQELKQAQDLLLRARSLAALGTLGAGVAHEINNPLTAVLGAAQLALLDLPTESPGHALVKDIEGQAQRIRRIVANLLRVAQKETGDELVPLDLNRVVDDAVTLIGPEELRKARIGLERRLGEVPPVRGNPVLLQEVVIELLTNARRAMPGGGTITLATSAPDPRIVSLQIRDTGKGIQPEMLDKIFDPFFTTKADWTATGMGLTLVHKIVAEHHGTIQVASEGGAGACFTLTFPSDAGRAHLE